MVYSCRLKSFDLFLSFVFRFCFTSFHHFRKMDFFFAEKLLNFHNNFPMKRNFSRPINLLPLLQLNFLFLSLRIRFPEIVNQNRQKQLQKHKIPNNNNRNKKHRRIPTIHASYMLIQNSIPVFISQQNKNSNNPIQKRVKVIPRRNPQYFFLRSQRRASTLIKPHLVSEELHSQKTADNNKQQNQN